MNHTELAIHLAEYLLAVFLHAVPWIGGAWIVTRSMPFGLLARERLWKLALIAPLFTAAIGGATSLELVADLPAKTVTPEMESKVSLPLEPPRVSVAPIRRLPDLTPVVVIRRWPLALVVLWLTLSSVSMIRLAAATWLWRRRLADRRTITQGPIVTELNRLRCEMALARPIRLTMTRRLTSPVTRGRDEVCLPVQALALDRSEIRALLAHELAHLGRDDRFWLWCGILVERAFLLQPLFRIARRQIGVLAEFACDREAAEQIEDPLMVARCLSRVASWIALPPRRLWANAFAAPDSLLVSRVRRLIEPVERRTRVPALWGGALISTVAFASGPQISIESLRPSEPKPSFERPLVQATAPARHQSGLLVSDAGLEIRLEAGRVVSASHRGEPIPEGRRLREPEGVRFLSSQGHDLGFLRTTPDGFAYDLKQTPRRRFVVAEDPAGSFSLEFDQQGVQAVYLGSRRLAPDRWLRDGSRLRVLRESGELDFEIELKPEGGISWSPRPGPS